MSENTFPQFRPNDTQVVAREEQARAFAERFMGEAKTMRPVNLADHLSKNNDALSVLLGVLSSVLGVEATATAAPNPGHQGLTALIELNDRLIDVALKQAHEIQQRVGRL